MEIFDNYYKRVDFLSKDQRQRRIDKVKKAMVRKFEGDPSYFEVNCREPDGSFSKKKIKVINADYVTHLNPNRIHSRYFVGHPDQVALTGSVFYGLYDADWFVTASANLTDVVDRGMIQRLNYIGKWIHEGVILESPALISGVSRRSDGIEENRYMTLPEDAIAISFPKNNDTDTLRRDMRFLVHGQAYKVTKVDRYTDPFLVHLIALEDLIEADDNLQEGIANYYENIELGEDKTIVGESFITYGITYEYSFINLEQNDFPITWNIPSGSGFVDVVSQDSEKIKIKVKNLRGIIGEQISIQGTTNTALVDEKILTISSLL